MNLTSKIKLPEAVKRALDSPRLKHWFRPSYPAVAVEVSARAVAAVALTRENERIELVGRRVVALPAGLVTPSLLRPAVSEPATLQALLKEAVAGLPGFDGRLSLLLPDAVARVTFVELEQQAATLSETTELVRWKLKRSTPFRVEESRISFQRFAQDGGPPRYLVSLVQTPVVEQFERLVEALGWECGLIDLSSFNLWNLAHDSVAEEGDSLLLSLDQDSFTAVFARGREPLIVRSKSPTGAESWSGAGKELRDELLSTLLYYQDRMAGTGLKDAFLRAPEALDREVRGPIEERFGVRWRDIPLGGVTGADQLSAAELYDLLPALGAARGR